MQNITEQWFQEAFNDPRIDAAIEQSFKDWEQRMHDKYAKSYHQSEYWKVMNQLENITHSLKTNLDNTTGIKLISKKCLRNEVCGSK
jgi:hypothetical protein